MTCFSLDRKKEVFFICFILKVYFLEAHEDFSAESTILNINQASNINIIHTQEHTFIVHEVH